MMFEKRIGNENELTLEWILVSAFLFSDFLSFRLLLGDGSSLLKLIFSDGSILSSPIFNESDSLSFTSIVGNSLDTESRGIV